MDGQIIFTYFIMSDLHVNLQRPGESLLSVLFSSGIAGETFQQLVLNGLNIRDRRNLRSTHRSLRGVLRGRPLTLTRRASDGSIQTVLNDNNKPVRVNSTVHWLGARCYGQRYPTQTPCNITPRTNVRIAKCTGIPPPLDRNSRYTRCCESVCRFCVISVTMHWDVRERSLWHDSRRAQLCRHCTLFQVRRNLDGLDTCNCRRLLSHGWKCHTCREETIIQLRMQVTNELDLLRETHRDHQGRMIHNPRLCRRRNTPCPGCGRSVINSQHSQGRSVIHCLLCKGLEVTPTRGAAWRSTALIPRQPTRRSARIAANYAQQPDLDYMPISIDQ